MEVDSVASSYVVLMAWVREIVNLYIIHHACADKAEAVLPQHYRIDGSLTDQQLALEVLGLVDEAGLFISLGIDSGVVHISFSVHHLIPFPVDHGTSCYGYLEYVRIVGYQ